MSKNKKYLRSLSALVCAIVVIGLQTNLASAYIENGGAAINVIGQVNTQTSNPIYNSGTVNNGEGSTNARGLAAPEEVEIDTTNHRLFVSDKGNARILVFNLTSGDILTDYTADAVLGQASFTTSSSGTTSTTVASPIGLSYDNANTRLFVSDYGNNRVLVYNVSTIENGEAAVNVLGQPNLTTVTALVAGDFTTGNEAITQVGLTSPRGIVYNSVTSRLFVNDYGNNRILSYNLSDGITNGEAAENVLGQTNFVSRSPATSWGGLRDPSGIEIDSTNGRLFVGEYANHRVIIYNINAIANGENAENVLGQANFTTANAATTAAGMSYPYGVAYDSGDNRLFVTAAGNNRTTVYDISTISNGQDAENVLGQANFTASAAGTTQTTLLAPYGASYVNGTDDLYVIDSGQHRVMVFDAAVDPGSGTPEFSTVTLLGTLLIGMYAMHKMRLDSSMGGPRASIA